MTGEILRCAQDDIEARRRIDATTSHELRTHVPRAVVALAAADDFEAAGEVQGAGADAHLVHRAGAEVDGGAEADAVQRDVEHEDLERLVVLADGGELAGGAERLACAAATLAGLEGLDRR